MKKNTIHVLLLAGEETEHPLTNELLAAIPEGPYAYKLTYAPDLEAVFAEQPEMGFDLILLEPPTSTQEQLAQLATLQNRLPDIPIIVLIPDDNETEGLRALERGAQDYLLKKQITPALFARSLRYAVERKMVEKTSQEALKRLRELSETKSQFVAEASHELRTPLGIIREFISLVHDGIAGPVTDKQEQCLASALRNCDRITTLIDRMLDLARIESGKAEINRERTDVGEILRQCYEDFLPECEAKKQTFEIDVPKQLPMAFCDRSTILNVLINLLGNANKFTQEGGSIRLECRHEGQFLAVTVEDNGPGIDPDVHEKIFEAFAQIDRENGPGSKGTGLGLAITKNLVELNGGYVSVDSTLNKGSRFTFTIPIYEKDAPRKVLIVDDESPVVRFILQALRKSELNLEIKSTTNGLESLVIAGQFNPHLVILDLHLAEVEGHQVLESLKQKMPSGQGRILAISGDAELLEESVARGADDYLEKPFSAKELVQKTVALLKIERRSR